MQRDLGGVLKRRCTRHSALTVRVGTAQIQKIKSYDAGHNARVMQRTLRSAGASKNRTESNDKIRCCEVASKYADRGHHGEHQKQPRKRGARREAQPNRWRSGSSPNPRTEPDPARNGRCQTPTRGSEARPSPGRNYLPAEPGKYWVITQRQGAARPRGAEPQCPAG